MIGRDADDEQLAAETEAEAVNGGDLRWEYRRLRRDRWMRALVLSPDLDATAKFVLLVIGLRMKPDGGGAYPPIRWIVERTGRSERTVFRALALGERAGWLQRVRYATGAGADAGTPLCPRVPPGFLRALRERRRPDEEWAWQERAE